MTQSGTAENDEFVPARLTVKNKFDEVFELEIEAWAYGLAKFPGQMTPALVHRVIKEIAPLFKGAIQHYYVFSLLDVADLIGQACSKVIDEKEIAFAILVNLPTPYELEEDAQFALAQVVDQAELKYGGVLERLERRWRGLLEGAAKPKNEPKVFKAP